MDMAIVPTKFTQNPMPFVGLCAIVTIARDEHVLRLFLNFGLVLTLLSEFLAILA